MAKSHSEAQLALALRCVHAPPSTPEYRFASPRMWRFDFAWPELLVAVEVDGVSGAPDSSGKRTTGRHGRAEGMGRDNEKINHATIAGWRVLRYTSRQVAENPMGIAREICALLIQSEKGTP